MQYWKLVLHALLTASFVYTLGLTKHVAAQVVLPPVSNQGIYPQCTTAPSTFRIKLVTHLADWPQGTSIYQNVNFNDYAYGVVMAELGPVVPQGPNQGSLWSSQVTRALAIAARTYGMYWCSKRALGDGTYGLTDDGDGPTYFDQEFNLYDRRFSSSQKQALINDLQLSDELYLVYSQPSARYRGVPVDAQHRRDTGDPSVSGWANNLGYAYMPSVYNPYTIGFADGFGLAQTPMQGWVTGGTGTAVWWQPLAHYYPGTHIMNREPTFTVNYYRYNGGGSCSTEMIASATTTNSINYDWGTGSLGPDSNNVCIYWRATSVPFANSWYTFYLAADDGIQLLVDGAAVLNRWFDQSSTLYSVSMPMTAGNHTIELRYYEAGGGAVARLFWRRWNGMIGTYYDGIIPATGTPSNVVKMQRPDPTINFDWGIGTANISSSPLDTRESDPLATDNHR